MQPTDYLLIKIEGQYATLKDINSENKVFIALDLLPPNVDIGSKLHCENFSYTLLY